MWFRNHVASMQSAETLSSSQHGAADGFHCGGDGHENIGLSGQSGCQTRPGIAKPDYRDLGCGLAQLVGVGILDSSASWQIPRVLQSWRSPAMLMCQPLLLSLPGQWLETSPRVCGRSRVAADQMNRMATSDRHMAASMTAEGREFLHVRGMVVLGT